MKETAVLNEIGKQGISSSLALQCTCVR